MNESFIHADVFFFVATIAVVIFSVGMILFFYYALRIAASIHKITEYMAHGTERLVGGLGALRVTIREEGAKLSYLTDFIKDLVLNGKKNTASRKRAVPLSKKENESI